LCTAARYTLQLAQHRQVGVACRSNKARVRQIGNRDKADMGVLAVEGTPGQRFVDILEPMGADEIGVVGDGAKVTGVGGAAFALSAHTDEAFPKQAAIGRAEMKFADQSRFADRMETRPFAMTIGECSLVEIEADDVTP